MLGVIAAIVTFVLPTAVIAVLLYWIIRLGVKHGLRSYEEEKSQRSDAVPAARLTE
ncbi:hypothetical protein QFZ23_002342 [Arthrobacter globiformis]|uniref:hypothetical protein n=1 Tax=Arthrobacter globiformis TaxID=1665 RepID=UPI002787CC33|nr:hypothetical protein [Arthrobacter globiformis]MDQ1058441.1 hypothetical protein [Arthrobacter globiformis]